MSFFDKFLERKVSSEDNTIRDLEISQIKPSQYQPRRTFAPDQLTELAQSLAKNGLLQPIIVRQVGAQQYEIIAGERRFRAAQQLKWTTIPALVRNYSDQQSASLALIENLQRQDLNPIEEARAYKKLAAMNNLRQEDLAAQLGKSQSYIANKLRLLKLDATVQQALIAGQITSRHGRALVSLTASQQQTALYKILQQQLNVAATERLVKQLKQPAKRATPKQHSITALKSRDPQLSINTIRESVQLAQKNGAEFTYQETDGDQEYQMIITVQKEDQHG
ncbi:Stage 0 DNA-binding protein [Bombilactobacillus mellifer]|uniref:Stage 0 DNA-binding protein n=1 Tax=Bombilactobacillus mellifer TaxID=1218492 RepID=A0A0F4LPI2_9LACO|nr:ParB/RepB/Spo0J family partition protein [Bombilactobacillus mellifer]KJY60500.1 Stage 0 DNA-binding protein [Bombilactobacillus mellifer]